LPRDSLRSVGSAAGVVGLKKQSARNSRKALSEDGMRQNRDGRKSTPSEPSDAASETSPSIPASSAHPSGQSAPGGIVSAAAAQTGSPQRNVVGSGGGAAGVVTGSGDDSYAEAIMKEVQEYREEMEGLRDGMDELRLQFKQEINELDLQLREEAERYQRLEEHLYELTELHQNAIEAIKSQVSEQESISHYQNQESLRAFRENLNMLETKVNNLETLQVQQQQYPQLEGWASGGDARALMMKLLTTAITFVQILFVVAGLLINTVTPFVRTPTRLTVTALAIAFLACYYYKQEDFLALVNKLKARTNFGGKNS